MRPVFPGATEKSQISHLPELLPLFERADYTAVKTAKAKEEDRTKIDPLEKSYVSTETGQVHSLPAARLTPLHGLSMPRSGRKISLPAWGLLPGAPTLTGKGLAPSEKA